MIESRHMGARIAGRLASTLLLFLIISVLVYFCITVLPGNRAAIVMGDAVDESAYALLEENNENYFHWLFRLFTLDLGESSFGGTPVSTLIASRIPVSLTLALSSLILALIFSFILVYLAITKKGPVGKIVYNFVSIMSLSMPSFIFALILVLIFSVALGLLPSGGYDASRPAVYLILPSISLAFLHSGLFMRMMKASLERELRCDYITLARAKGLPQWKVILVHAGKNILFDILPLIFQSFVTLFCASAAVEYLFSVPGLGALATSAIARRDANTIVALVMLAALVSVLSSFVADLISILCNRRFSDEA